MNPKSLGTLLGGASGAGLGAMTAGLIGVNPALGLLGAIPGSIGGSRLGQWYAQNTNPQTLTNASQMQALAQRLDAQSGTTAFTQALANDPQGFARNIASQYGGVY